MYEENHIGHTSQWTYIYSHHIQCGVRQGCPLSTILFVLCLTPLLYYLDERLQGLRTHGTQRKNTVIAYADDDSILVTSQEDARNVRDYIAY